MIMLKCNFKWPSMQRGECNDFNGIFKPLTDQSGKRTLWVFIQNGVQI